MIAPMKSYLRTIKIYIKTSTESRCSIMDQIKLVEKAAFKKIEMTWSATAVFQILPGIYA